MALEDYRNNMLRCLRCSQCKWVPAPHVKSWRFAQICPSISKYNFHAYSGGGRVIAALSLLMGRCELNDNLLDIIYQCQLCGACDVDCRAFHDHVEPLDVMRELRIKCVGEGYVLPEHQVVIGSLKSHDNMMEKPKEERGKWSEGLDIKDLTKKKGEVLFHAGCRLSYDQEQWPFVRKAVTLLKGAGVDVGILGNSEVCCGGHAYNMGYVGECVKYAENNRDAWRAAGVKKIVVACADGYGTLQNIYPKVLSDFSFEVVHISQYVYQLIQEGKIELRKKLNMRVTYHDPCNLGRLGEHFDPWKGVEKRKKGASGALIVFDPPKPGRHGIHGVYEEPRNIIKAIPGVKLIEMERIKAHSWCCGAGGGVVDAYPDFGAETAKERLEEAKSTGAEAIVTNCPWCYRILKDSAKQFKYNIGVIDLMELVSRAM